MDRITTDLITTGGLRMPKLGFGAYRLTGDACRESTASALALGYRHIDTAQMYGNEDAVGAAIAESGIPRADIHLTTKVWWTNLAPDSMRRAMDESLTALRTDYVDLYLVHWPAAGMDMRQVMQTLVALQQEGRARHIGVANFTVALLREAIEGIGAPIVCNQIEYHVLLDQTPVLAYARSRGVAITAYAPLAQGRLAEYPALAEIARKHGATPAQVALQYLLAQDGVAAIPKAARGETQQANLGAFKVHLDDDDFSAIARLPKDQRFVKPAFAPQWDVT